MNDITIEAYLWMCRIRECGPMSVQVYWYSCKYRLKDGLLRYMVNPNTGVKSRYGQKRDQLQYTGPGWLDVLDQEVLDSAARDAGLR